MFVMNITSIESLHPFQHMILNIHIIEDMLKLLARVVNLSMQTSSIIRRLWGWPKKVDPIGICSSIILCWIHYWDPSYVTLKLCNIVLSLRGKIKSFFFYTKARSTISSVSCYEVWGHYVQALWEDKRSTRGDLQCAEGSQLVL